MSDRKIKAIIFDLDDTLYDQFEWLDGAFEQVSRFISGRFGIDQKQVHAKIKAIAIEKGTSSGHVFDMTLSELGLAADPIVVKEMVLIFRSHQVRILHPYPGVVETLSALKRSSYKLGMLTDGEVRIQEGKIGALGIKQYFDAIVVSDMLGREFRKPHPKGYLHVAALLGVSPPECVYVADNPAKDFKGAKSLGMMTVRVFTGEYKRIMHEEGEVDVKINGIKELSGIFIGGGGRGSA